MIARSGRYLIAMFEYAGRLLRHLRPPKQWLIPVIFLGAVFCGISTLIVHLSNAASYLSDDPKACMNCHIMAPQYATWQRGSHGRVATCNDCHVPHDTLARKYFFKAQDGTRHSFMFTFHMEPQVIRVHQAGVEVIQENCVRCHENQLSGTSLAATTGKMAVHGEGKLCWDCHRETPHGKVNSLAAVPNARVPYVGSAIPSWIENLVEARKKESSNSESAPAGQGDRKP